MVGKKEVVVKDEIIFHIDTEQKIPELPSLTNKETIDIRYPLIPPYAYAHIYWDKDSKELMYVIEEPILDVKEKGILTILEDGIRELINLTFISVKEGNTLIQFLEKNIKVLLSELGINVTKETFNKIMYFIYRDFVGMNEIEPLLCDYFIEDIECNGTKFPLYLVHRKYRNLRTNIVFNEVPKLARFVEKVAQKCGKYVSYSNPLLDGSLPDGSRVNATYTVDVSSRGPTFCFADGYFQLANGELIKINELFKDCKKRFGFKNENGNEIVEVYNMTCCGVDENNLTQKISNLKSVIKLKPPKELVEVILEDGASIKVTTNHLFHVFDDKLKLIEAKNLENEMFIPVPVNVNVNGCLQTIDIVSLLKEFSYSHKICIKSNVMINNIVNDLILNNNQLELSKEYNVHGKYFYEVMFRGNSVSFEVLEQVCKNKNIEFDNLGDISLVVYGGGVSGKTKAIKVPKVIDEDLAYLTGAIISDGHLSENSIDVACYNESFGNAVKNVFENKFKYTNFYYFGNRIYLCNKFAAFYFNKVFEIPYGKKSNIVKVPELIFKSDNKVVASFIRGLFDGDGTCNSGLSYKTNSKELAEQLTYLLARLGIYSYLRESSKQYKVTIPSLYEKIYSEKVGFNNINKKQGLIKLLNKKIKDRAYSRHGRVPIKPFLNLMKESGISKNQISKKFDISYSRLINYNSISRPLAKNILSLVNEEKYKYQIDSLNWLIDSNQEFVKIKTVKVIKNEDKTPVYDIELDPCKFFIAGNKPMNIFDTIRKFTKEPWSPTKYIQMRTASPELLAYLWMLIEHEFNVMVIGGTGSGKTSLLNCLAFFIPPQARVVTIEDTRELNLEHDNWLPSVAREGIGLANIVGQKYGEVSLFDLLKESFRQNPDYVIVGEVRGAEAFVLFQGMASGHPSFGTMHADDVKTMIRRLETPPINLSPALVESMNAVCVMNHVKVKGVPARRVKEVVEVVGVKEELGEAITNQIFAWNPTNDSFIYNANSNVLNELAKDAGISKDKVYNEMRLRAQLLTKMTQAKILEFREVQNVINEYYATPETILKKFNIK